MIRVSGLLLTALAAGCASQPQVILTEDIQASTVRALDDYASRDTSAVDPRSVGTLMVITVEPPATGEIIGGHYEGIQFNRLVGSIAMTDELRQRWMRELRVLADSTLRATGFRVRDGAGPTSDATAMRGVRLTLSARIQSLTIRSVGRADPLVRASAAIEWQLMDLARGSPALIGTVPGSAPDGPDADLAVRRAFRASLETLLASPQFRAALPRPREAGMEEALAAEWTRMVPRAGDTVLVRPVRRRPDEATHALAGLVALRDLRNYRGTAVVLTRDGLAIAPPEAASREWLFARFSNGEERPVRVLRPGGDLVLLEVSCPDGCPSVAWDEGGDFRDGQSVYVISARSLGIAYQRGALRPRNGDWSVRGAGRRAGGEAVVDAQTGAVVGVATRSRVLPLRAVFELLLMSVED